MATCSQILSRIKNNYGDAENYRAQVLSAKNNAYTQWLAGNDHLAILALINGFGKIYFTFSELIDFDYPGAYESPIWSYLRDCTGGGVSPAVTMADILSAMMQATNEEYKQFIGIVDAYRTALWNQPFNVEFYAALARGFSEWG